MRVYLASSFKLMDWVKAVRWEMEKVGIEITVVWWETNFKSALGEMTDDEWYSRPEIERIRKRNFQGIDDADALVLVCDPIAPCKFNGANVEVGYALGKGKPVYSIGALERSGMYQEVIRCSSPTAVINDLLSPNTDRGDDQ